MRIFSWLTGNKDHHIEITEGKAPGRRCEQRKSGKWWWRIIRVEETVKTPPGTY